jgi:hypothetical protein
MEKITPEGGNCRYFSLFVKPQQLYLSIKISCGGLPIFFGIAFQLIEEITGKEDTENENQEQT